MASAGMPAAINPKAVASCSGAQKPHDKGSHSVRDEKPFKSKIKSAIGERNEDSFRDLRICPGRRIRTRKKN